MNLGFPSFSFAKAAADGVKPIWQRSAFRGWVLASLGLLTALLTGVPQPITWEVCWKGIVGLGLTAAVTLFFGDDSSPPPPLLAGP